MPDPRWARWAGLPAARTGAQTLPESPRPPLIQELEFLQGPLECPSEVVCSKSAELMGGEKEADDRRGTLQACCPGGTHPLRAHHWLTETAACGFASPGGLGERSRPRLPSHPHTCEEGTRHVRWSHSGQVGTQVTGLPPNHQCGPAEGLGPGLDFHTQVRLTDWKPVPIWAEPGRIPCPRAPCP